MAPQLFSEEGEARFMQVWRNILEETQGQMRTQLDKLRIAAKKMKELLPDCHNFLSIPIANLETKGPRNLKAISRTMSQY